MRNLLTRLRAWRAAEAAKLRPLSFREKTGYIFMYYKGWMLALLLVVMAAGYVGDAVVQSHKEIILQGFFTNDEGNFFPAEQLEQDYAAILGLGRRQRIVFDDDLYIDLNDEATEYTAASNGKLIAYMAVGELDFVVTTQAVYEHYAGDVPMQDFSQLLPETLYNALADRLITGTDKDGNPAPVALDMRESRFLSGADTDDGTRYVMFVPYNAPHTDALCAFIAYCFPDAAGTA